MKSFPTLLALALLAPTGLAQTVELFSIPRPADVNGNWGARLLDAGDLTGDGVPELLVGRFEHGGGTIATVHSGVDGARLYTLAAPQLALFFGDGFAVVGDQNGDGVSEIVALGSSSGDANSFEGRIQVHSGSDGALLFAQDLPQGLRFGSLTQDASLALADLDGDGSEDVLCPTVTGGLFGGGLTVFSSGTGLPLYTIQPSQVGAVFLGDVALLDDLDGDGTVDFAALSRVQWEIRVEVRSGASGALIDAYEAKSATFATGNGEPFLSVQDLTGDGVRDLAAGAVFSAFAGVFDAKGGAELRRWECPASSQCVGIRLVEVADFTGDGHDDLFTLGFDGTHAGSGPLELVGLDPVTGDVRFREAVPGLFSTYGFSKRLVRFDGAGAASDSTFAAVLGSEPTVSVRRTTLRRR